MRLVRTHRFSAVDVRGPSFACRVQRHGQTSTIELDGELDIAARPALGEAGEGAVAGPVDTVVVDLTRATFADSSTMAWLVILDNRILAAGSRLVVVAGDGPVLDVLRLTGLDRRLTLVDHAPMR